MAPEQTPQTGDKGNADPVTEHIYEVLRTMNGHAPAAPRSGEIGTVNAARLPIEAACFDRETVESLVGDVSIPESHQPGNYDEREEVIRSAVSAIQRMRERNHALATALGIAISEDEMHAWRPNDAEQAQLRKELARERKRAAMVRGVETYINDQVMLAAAEGIRLRPHQQDVAIGTRNFVINASRTTEKGGKSGLIEQPTGTGKTRLMVETAAMLKHEEDPAEPIRILVLTPTNRIQKQTVGRDGKRGFGKFAPDLDVGQYDESVPLKERKAELAKDVMVMCVPSFLNLLEKGELPDYDAVIVDEAQTVLGDRTSEKLTDYTEDKVTIGVTATPDRDDGRTARDIFIHKIAEMLLSEAVQGGLLAPVTGYLRHVAAKINPRTLPTDPSERREAIRAAYAEAKEDEAVKIIKEELERGYAEVPGEDGIGVIVRCQPGGDIEQAYRLAKRLRGMYVKGPNGPMDMRPIMPAFVGGTSRRQSRGVREEVFEAAEGRKVNVITNVSAVNIGYDNDHTKVHINLVPAGKVASTQGGGRALRIMRDKEGKPIRGKDGKFIRASLYDIVSELDNPDFTVLNLLGTSESGKTLENDERGDAPIPRRRTMGERQERYIRPAEVMNVVATTIGTAALEGQAELDEQTAAALETELPEQTAPEYKSIDNPLAPSGWPTQSGLEEFAETFGGDTEIPQQEAARLLGISSSTLKGLLNNMFGDPLRTPTLTNVAEILAAYPLLQAPPAPGLGYTEISRKDIALRTYARSEGMHLHRFTRQDGTVSYYLSNNDLHELLARKTAQESKA
jgi:superfamily II DNA or RNA helicase